MIRCRRLALLTLLRDPSRPAVAARVDVAPVLPATAALLLQGDQVGTRIGGRSLFAARKGERAGEDQSNRGRKSNGGTHGLFLPGVPDTDCVEGRLQ